MTASEKLFEEVSKGGVSLIEGYCKERRAEDLHIDFKEKANPTEKELSNEDKANLSKALSGFANSEGGVIVWGVEAKPVDDIDAACTLKAIKHLDIFENKVHGLIKELTSPAIENVQLIKIYKEKSNGFLVMHIPQSDEGPYMATGKDLHRYYLRQGDSFRKMEHYQIALMFGRRPQAKLELSYSLFLHAGECYPPPKEIHFNVKLIIRNRGRGIAKYPCLCISKPTNYELLERSLPRTASGGEFLKAIKCTPPWTAKYVAEQNQVIYPTDEIIVAQVYFKNLMQYMLDYMPISIDYGLYAEDTIPIKSTLVISKESIAKKHQDALMKK